MGCILKIKEMQTTMTETESLLANYILHNKEQVITMSSQLLAQKTKTSPAAVIRFSKKIGYNGFSQLKIELAKDTSEQEADIDFMINENDTTNALINKVYQSNLQTIDKTFGLIESSSIDQAIKLINSSKSIYLYGLGSSGIVCEDFMYKLLRIGKPVVFLKESHSQLTYTPSMTLDDLAIIVSYSGQTKEIAVVAKSLKEKNIPYIIISKASNLEIISNATVSIQIPSEEQLLRVGAISSRMSSLIIMDLLYFGIIKNDMNKTKQRLIETKLIIDEIQ